MDEEKLATTYNKALALEKAGDFDAAALAYRDVLDIDPDDHGGASVRMASIGKAQAPSRAPKAYVTTLFDQHAELFDKILVNDLGYDVPEMSAQLLTDKGLYKFNRVLDLGCGTGLMGAHLSDQAHSIIGVDLSEKMIEIAFDKDIYEALYVADIEDYLTDNEDKLYDLITIGDVFPYLGDIDNLVKGISDNLTLDGHVIFSTETLADEQFGEDGFIVSAYQRFAHQLKYIKSAFQSHGFKILTIENITVRHEQGHPVSGHLILAKNNVS